MYELLTQINAHIPKADQPHFFYIIAGASGILFCAASECKRLTGLDPLSKKAIERHADLVADLIAPDSG